MKRYQAFYGRERIEVQGESSYKAQLTAAAKFKTRKVSEVIVILLDGASRRMSPSVPVHSPPSVTL